MWPAPSCLLRPQRSLAPVRRAGLDLRLGQRDGLGLRGGVDADVVFVDEAGPAVARLGALEALAQVQVVVVLG